MRKSPASAGLFCKGGVGVELRIFTLEQVYSGDTYEIAHSGHYTHWAPDSLYFPDDIDTFEILEPHLNAVFGDFNWYGPQQVTLEQWRQVERRCKILNLDNPTVPAFFETIRQWLSPQDLQAGYFWILGI